jgi:hypothetical protein
MFWHFGGVGEKESEEVFICNWHIHYAEKRDWREKAHVFTSI